MSGEYSTLYSYLRYCVYSYLFIYAPTEWQTLKKIRQAFELSQSVYLPPVSAILHTRLPPSLAASAPIDSEFCEGGAAEKIKLFTVEN